MEEAPAEIPVASLQKSSKDMAREREELLKYEEAVRLFREEGRTAEAYSMLDGFLAMHPDSSYADDALLEQARIRIFEDQPKKAVSILKRLLHDFPTSHLKKTANLELERIYYSEKKWRDCIESGDNVLSFDPLPDERVEALTMRAVCRFRKRDRDQAVNDVIEASTLEASEKGRPRLKVIFSGNDEGVAEISKRISGAGIAVMGFSTKTSLPARTPWTAQSACQ